MIETVSRLWFLIIDGQKLRGIEGQMNERNDRITGVAEMKETTEETIEEGTTK